MTPLVTLTLHSDYTSPPPSAAAPFSTSLSPFLQGLSLWVYGCPCEVEGLSSSQKLPLLPAFYSMPKIAESLRRHKKSPQVLSTQPAQVMQAARPPPCTRQACVSRERLAETAVLGSPNQHFPA